MANSQTSVSGYALVRLKTGRTYVGWTVYDGRSVTITGCLRLIVNGVVEYRRRGTIQFPWLRVHEILWDEQ